MNQYMKRSSLTIKELFSPNAKLTFLVGAGCSIDPPSSLPSSREILNEIVRYSCPIPEIENILNIKNLRFEDIYAIYMKDLDNDAKIMDYFELCDKPNYQHFFLAEMIKKGNFVMSINEDFLIEYALQQSKVPDDEIFPVITKNDFEQFKDPYDLFKRGKKAIYKLHGSTKNIITGENTRDSLSSFQKEYTENFRQKQSLLRNISDGRSLVAMGISYYGISSILRFLKNITNFIWINHKEDDEGKEKVYEFNSDSIQDSNNSDQILDQINEIYRYAGHVYRVDANTTRIAGDLLTTKPELSSDNFSITPMDWLKNNIKEPNKLTKYLISYKVYIDNSMYSDALRCAEITLEISKNLGDKSNVAKILNNIGRIYYVYGDYDNALKRFEEALQINEELGIVLRYSTIIKNIGEIYRAQGNYSEALKKFEEALKIDEQLGDLLGKASSLNKLGKIYTLHGDYHQALSLYNEALQINEELGNLAQKANLINNIGEIYRIQGKYSEARKNFEEALKIDEQRGNLLGKATELNNIGLIYYAEENYDNALENFKNAIKISEQIGDLPGIATRLNNIGLIYYAKKNYPEALNYYEKAFQTLDQLGDLPGKAISMNNIGMIYQVQNKYTEAAGWYNQALQIEEQIGNLSGKFTSLNNLGILYHAQENYPNALKIYEKALKIGEQLGDLKGKANILYNVGMTFQAQGDYLEATKNYKAAYEILEELQLSESSLAKAIKENIKALRWDEEKEIIEQILEYEFKNQEFITKKAMVKEFNIKITKMSHYLELLNISENYDHSEIPQLETICEELIKNDEELTMHNLILELGFNLLTTKKIAKFLIDYEIIDDFPRFSKKRSKPIEKDKKKIYAISQEKLISNKGFENRDSSYPKQISTDSLEEGSENIEENKVMGEFFETQKKDLFSSLVYLKGDQKKTILAFLSYATKDSERFDVPKIAEKLMIYPEIENVLYWEEDLSDDIYMYMNDNLGKCHAFLLICSENALNSKPVRMEWMTALRLEKKIVPIFIEEGHIPNLLKNKLGIQFKRKMFDETVNKIHDLILKKLRNKE